MKRTSVFDVFAACTDAIVKGVLIRQVSLTDKEYHFQNWFEARLTSTGLFFDKNGRNAYPDFVLVDFTEGYETKGLGFPGRDASYDCNSQVPSGFHNGRDVFYVFGRYPAAGKTGHEYPVVDLVICHGDFLNADHEYKHENRHVRGFGTYGDIMVRDRKMYVAPTPFAIAAGLVAQRTLIIPETWPQASNFRKVGVLNRVEASQLVTGYEFDLTTRELTAKRMPNPHAGTVHTFHAYRPIGESAAVVSLVTPSTADGLEKA